MAAKLVADAWCAAFVQPKTGAHSSGQGITHATVRALSEAPESVPDTIITAGQRPGPAVPVLPLALGVPRYLHGSDEGSADAGTGWTGGFSCVIGNPPWETSQAPGQGYLRQRRQADIEGATPQPIRRKIIDKLADTDPDLVSSVPYGAPPFRCHRASPPEERTISTNRTGRRQHLQCLRRDHADHRRLPRSRPALSPLPDLPPTRLPHRSSPTL